MGRRHHKVFVHVGFCARFACTFLYVNKGGNKKTLQTIHKPYILLFILLIIRTLRNVWFALQTIHKLYTNYTQTIHKLYIEPYTEPYTASVQNPTQRAYAKLYTKRNTNHTFCLVNTNCSRIEQN